MDKKTVESTDNKCWVTVSININLGNYENAKVESGYSQTIPIGKEPLELLEEMQDGITPVITSYVRSLRKQLTKKKE